MRNPKKKSKTAKGSSTAAPPQAPRSQGPMTQSVWQPGADPIDEGEVLQYDPSAYDCLHAFSLDWPCLSFDVLRDELGGPRSSFPHALYMVAGTQATPARANYFALIKLANLGQGKHGSKAAAGSDDELSDSDDEEDSVPPLFHTRMLAHHGGVNRVRSMPQQPGLIATWGDGGQVQVWDATAQVDELVQGLGASKPGQVGRGAPKQLFQHTREGYALDWSKMQAGRLASGDCASHIHVWEPAAASDDGLLRVWDLRNFKPGAFVANFSYHRNAITSVEWSPHESSMLATTSADGQLAVWDLALERDPEEEASLAASGSAQAPEDLPPQLLFVHSGQHDMKELHWHPQIPGMLISTAADGFNVFKPANVQ
ncbi:hypothetical protein WJX72_000900 [[Myrmecia] bisecta]|uniref:Histone-binding protein RBBP4-like N-terminal domain-containing protein n=1 Tax=[Myrmecia] bisecta TaxID=41462 RepID=A0AAW1PS34_9CHLO